MIGPLAKTGVVSEQLNMWLALFPIGFLFGFGLQRAGFTHACKIAHVFYVKDVDVAVVMFTAMVIGALGLWGMSLLGLVDTARIYFLPTYLAPMAVGGVLFGVGMVVGGYCPGTALAAMATGKLDALVFILGFFVGTVLFGDYFPVWGDFYRSDYLGVYRIDQLFGINLGSAVLLLVVVAVLGSIGLRKLQIHFWHTPVCTPTTAVRSMVVVGLLLGLVLALFPTRDFFAIENTAGSAGGWDKPWTDPYAPVVVDAFDAGRILYDNADRSLVIDLRERAAWQRGHLAAARNMDLKTVEHTEFLPGSVILLYDDGTGDTAKEAMKWLRSRRGLEAYAVEGGFPALQALYLAPLTPQVLNRLEPGQQQRLRQIRAMLGT